MVNQADGTVAGEPSAPCPTSVCHRRGPLRSWIAHKTPFRQHLLCFLSRSARVLAEPASAEFAAQLPREHCVARHTRRHTDQLVHPHCVGLNGQHVARDDSTGGRPHLDEVCQDVF
jgi:hypothetical protein